MRVDGASVTTNNCVEAHTTYLPCAHVRQTAATMLALRHRSCCGSGARRSPTPWSVAHGHRSATNLACSASKRAQPAEALTSGLVTVLTEGLRMAGVGKDRYQELTVNTAPPKLLKKGDVRGVMSRIKRDFDKNAYIITGILDDAIYDENCRFADPTVAFSGLALWKRNLQLLVPFLVEPSVKLLELKRAGKDETGAQLLESEWLLETTLSLPWRPFISVIGRTIYTLNPDANQVVEHVETWNVSGTEAVLQILRPGQANR